MKNKNIRVKYSITIVCLLFFMINISAQVLENEKLKVNFSNQGLVSVYDKELKEALKLSNEQWSFTIDKDLIESSKLAPIKHNNTSNRVSYFYTNSGYEIEVVYELKPGWRFVSKQLFISNKNKDTYMVNSINLFHGHLTNISDEIVISGLGENSRKSRGLGDYGAFVRMDDNWGGMFLVQNPFFNWKINDGNFSLEYKPEMEWKTAYGTFASDRACIGTYNLTGYYHPGDLGHREKWLMEPTWGKKEQMIDEGEVQAFIDCVRSFMLYKPEKSVRVHIPWCENDYQIDVATEYGVEQYKRIVDATSALDIGHMLYTVRNTDIALAEEATDNWGWEHLLWLNMGPKIRKAEWDPKTDVLPDKTLELQEYAKSKNVNLMAYVYPTLEFQQNKVFLTPRSENNPQMVASFGVREFQDWFIENLVAFKERTGISGYSFDYWSMKVGTLSRYSQWYGGRRVLEELRKQAPDVVIDGRQQYHGYGAWTWLAGTYPHPTGGDEQPESFEPFPDLHFDRSSANQQRLTSYWFRNVQFCPTEIMPGFITHQTARKDSNGAVHRESDMNLRDWDYLGWKYSLISSVATAPFAHGVDMIPARDKKEHELFMKDTESQKFMTDWFDWTDDNATTLKNLRSIIGPPQIGRVDGTAAIDGDHGFIFVFNPNHRKVNAEFILDESIGLTEGDSFILKQIFPLKDTYVGAPNNGVYKYGDTFSKMMDGTSAWVLEINPYQDNKAPILLNAQGKVKYEKDILTLAEIKGEVGTEVDIQVLLPQNKKVKQVTVNGENKRFIQNGNLVSINCQFEGKYFGHNQAVTEYESSFNDDTVKSTFVIPKRIFTQLKERKKKWNIDWTEDDLVCTWLAPERLLLYIQLAEPDWKMEASMKINGKPVEVIKAYSSRTPGRLKMGKGSNTFTGFYVDVSDLNPDVKYQVELELPHSLKPGQFQGMFFENVEPEYTSEIVNGI